MEWHQLSPTCSPQGPDLTSPAGQAKKKGNWAPTEEFSRSRKGLQFLSHNEAEARLSSHLTQLAPLDGTDLKKPPGLLLVSEPEQLSGSFCMNP